MFFYNLTISRTLAKKFFASLNDFLRLYSQKNIIKSRIMNVFVMIAKKNDNTIMVLLFKRTTMLPFSQRLLLYRF